MPHKPKTVAGSLGELILIVAVALGLALGIQAVLVKPYRIPSESMVPTLEIGQRVLVNRIGNRLGTPKIGEVVVFTPPADASGCARTPRDGAPCANPGARAGNQAFIKRLVAGPGDRVLIKGGRVIRNGRPERGTPARACGGTECDFTRTITIPSGHYYLMGDNRGASSDSRVWGPIPREWIIGEAFATYWPPRRIGLL